MKKNMTRRVNIASKIGFTIVFLTIASICFSQEKNENFVSTDATGTAFVQDLTIRGGLMNRKNLQIWGIGYMSSGEVKPEQNVSIDSSHNGGMIGVNCPFGSLGTLSGYYSFSESQLEETNWKNKQTTHLGGIGLYKKLGCAYYSLLGNYGLDSYSPEPNIFPEKPKGSQASGYFEAGFEMGNLRLFNLKPFTALMYNYLEHDGVTEKIDYSAFFTINGARIDIQLPGMLEAFKFQARAAWLHQLLSYNDSISTKLFSRIPGTLAPIQLIYVGDPGRDYLWFGAGMKFGLGNKISFTLDYDLLTNESITTHLGSAGVLLRF